MQITAECSWAAGDEVMVYEGTIANGAVVLDNGAHIPDGTLVKVIVPVEKSAPPRSDEPTLRWMLKYAGTVDDMPPDFAAQHDHYIHGTPKR
jgi:hypothetical protein